MFRGASLFNRDVAAWTTSNVVNMESAFRTARAFNQDLSKWLVSKGTVISLFFCGVRVRQANLFFRCFSLSKSLT